MKERRVLDDKGINLLTKFRQKSFFVIRRCIKIKIDTLIDGYRSQIAIVID